MRPATITRPAFLLLTALLLLTIATALGQTPTDRQGYFHVRSADTRLVDGVQVLDARLQLVLSDEALNALNNGVPLTIELRLEVIRVRRFFPDAVDAELELRYELEYRPLSQRYIVRSLNTGNQDSFATLYSALNNLGRIEDLPVVDASILEAESDYRMRLQALLSTRQYPAPLRMLFFWRGQWQLKSEWFEWQVEH